jgi:hypothetical protein
VAWATYKKQSFKLTQGNIRWRESSPGVTRGHCADCGTSISYENENRPGDIDIGLNALKDPSVPSLKAHIWTEDKPEWLQIGDDLPVYAKNIG